MPDENYGLSIFQSAFGRPPQSEEELSTINDYNNIQTQQEADFGVENYPDGTARFPVTALDQQVDEYGQARDEFSQPTAFLSFLKAGLKTKLQPEQEQLGTSPLFEQAGLTGMPTLMQSLGSRQDQLIRSGKDLAAVLQTSSGIYTDYYNLLNNKYTDLVSQQEMLIKQQWKVEDDFRNFNQDLYKIQKAEELDRETRGLQAELDVWESGQKETQKQETFAYEEEIERQTTAWEEELARETYAYEAGIDLESEAYEAALDAQNRTPNTQIITADGTVKLVDKDTGDVIQDFGSAYKTTGEGTTTGAKTTMGDTTTETPLKKTTKPPADMTWQEFQTAHPERDWSGYVGIKGTEYDTAEKRAQWQDVQAVGGTLYGKKIGTAVIPQSTSEMTTGVAYKFPDSPKVYQWTGTELKHIPDEATFQQIYGGLPEENTNYLSLPGTYNNFISGTTSGESTVSMAGTNQEASNIKIADTKPKDTMVDGKFKNPTGSTTYSLSNPELPGVAKAQTTQGTIPVDKQIFTDQGGSTGIWTVKDGKLYVLDLQQAVSDMWSGDTSPGFKEHRQGSWKAKDSEVISEAKKKLEAALGTKLGSLPTYNIADVGTAYAPNIPSWKIPSMQKSLEEFIKLIT